MRRSWDALETLARDAADLPPVLVGLPEPNPSDEGRPLFNSAVLLRDGRVDQRFRKALLPTYDVFDEDRYFEPFHGAQVLDLGGHRLGISICEDIWNDRDFWKRRRYHHDPIEELVGAGADVVVNLSASPFSVGKHRRREEMLSSMARKHRVPIVYVNQFGGNDDLVFDGRSCMFNADGAVFARGRAFEPDVVVCDIEAAHPIAPASDLGVESEIWRALVLGTRDYARKCGFSVGRARPVRRHRFGADRRDCRRGARRRPRARRADAVALLQPGQPRRCARAGPEPRHRDDDAADRAADASRRRDAARRPRRRPAGTSPQENIQARIRGNLLMALSNKRGALLLTTGNKSELSVGYCTLYGDMSGGLAVIADVPKTMVYRIVALAERLGGTAGDSRGDVDESAVGRAAAESDRSGFAAALRRARRHPAAPRRAASAGRRDHRRRFRRDTVERVLRLVRIAEFKRKQAAPGLKVTDRAFGTGWRMPIAARLS